MWWMSFITVIYMRDQFSDTSRTHLATIFVTGCLTNVEFAHPSPRRGMCNCTSQNNCFQNKLFKHTS